MKICILNPVDEESDSPTTEYDLPCDPSPYLDGHETILVDIRKSTVVQQITQLVSQGYDVYINLCDGAKDEDQPGIEVVRLLEEHNVAFTGANSGFYEPTREEMKAVCWQQGILAPAYVMARSAEDVAVAARILQFPLIVKHPNSYGSIGLSRTSRVEQPDDLLDVASDMIAKFGATLIEEFIEGREFTVLIAENPEDASQPIAFPPVEFRFPEGESFKHFNMKWIEYHCMSCLIVDDDALVEQLVDMSCRVFTGLSGTSYARCDIRMNQAGELYLLEINPNCGIFYPLDDPGSADYILINTPNGHKTFVDLILRAALKRYH